VPAPPPHFIVLMGVAGTGKTTVGKLVASELGWKYLEADDFHSAANKAKMAAGTPLTDDDRMPWLDAMRAAMDDVRRQGGHAVVTCSALKDAYRRRLLRALTPREVLLVFLRGDAATILARVSGRVGHFMKSNMVQSQLEILEPPADALTLDIDATPEDLAARIVAAARGPGAGQ
jgi:gluconokinase